MEPLFWRTTSPTLETVQPSQDSQTSGRTFQELLDWNKEDYKIEEIHEYWNKMILCQDALAEAKSFVLHKELQRLGADEDVLNLQASAEVQSAEVARSAERLGGAE